MKILKRFRSALLEFLTHDIALPLISRFRVKPPFNYTSHQLLQLPEGTLGHDLAAYLQRKGFSLLRNYEQHDCKHIIFEYEMDEAGEARMQFYFLGNRHYTVPVLATVLISALLMPEHWRQFSKEFKRGRRNKPFEDTDYNLLVQMRTVELRKFYNR